MSPPTTSDELEPVLMEAHEMRRLERSLTDDDHEPTCWLPVHHLEAKLEGANRTARWQARALSGA
jgi:hypothetical protein